jgi:hypothetical protein
MKTGRTLDALAAEINRQAESKRDYLADTRALTIRPAGRDGDPVQTGMILDGVNGGLRINPTAHAQLAEFTGIPRGYYDRMMSEAPELLARNVNNWLGAQPKRRMVRTLDGAVRAFLSDSYRPLDNIDLAQAVLPSLAQLGVEVQSGEVTEHRFYLKAVTSRLQGEVKRGDVIQAGIAISNSEIGGGALRVEELDFRLVCLNGMIRESSVRQAHLGRSGGRLDAIEDAREYFKNETRSADDKAFFLKLRDAVGAMFTPARFEARLDKYRAAAEVRIEGDPVKVIEATAKRLSLTEAEKGGVLRHLIEGGDLSAWGLANAVTRASQDVESYDRATELEALGGRIIELKPNEWKALAV